jgi:hypothetical protein
MTNLATRIHRGAALLDEHCPGWIDKIDLPSLQMSNGYQCILGQLYDRDYWSGLVGLGLDRDWWAEVDYGFQVDRRQLSSRTERSKGAAYGNLTRGWRQYIQGRRTTEPQPLASLSSTSA